MKGDAGDSFHVVPFANAEGRQFSPAISPDSRKIAFVWDENRDRFNIYVKDIASGQTNKITDDDRHNRSPSWAPSGQEIAFLRKENSSSDVLIQSLHEGAPQIIGHIRTTMGNWVSDTNPASAFDGPVWSSDGKSLLVSDSVADGNGLILISIETGERKVLTVPSGLSHDYYPRFSPDGQALAFVRYPLTGSARYLHAP